MSLTRKDTAATVVTALVALVYLANTHDWGVPLLTSNRWAAGAVGLLGFASCTLGRGFDEGATLSMTVLSALGVATLGLLVAAIWTGAQWALGLLVLGTLALWALSTARHAASDVIRGPHPA
ncbi:MAG TPA: hypothetical protein VJ986_07735 [Gaiellaceae bacterium]|nr:hypothetical protein [Gaiellaceae bacterium]